MVATRISDTVHALLRERILSGELPPGSAVSSERDLSEQLGVNRHAIREALNRLQQARLVHVTQGGPTRVLDWRVTGGLELITDLARDPGNRLDAGLTRAIIEMRACIGVDVARRAAERGSATQRERAAQRAEAAAQAADLPQRARANEALWTELVDGAGNIAYRLALNSLLEGVAAHPDLDAQLNTPAADEETLRRLAQGLREADAEAAAQAARQLLELA
jgi:GntR family transcriptional regulator, transcriptional repressor for pyruvate dehydrogenase complex